jgi:hypothetical protein
MMSNMALGSHVSDNALLLRVDSETSLVGKNAAHTYTSMRSEIQEVKPA